MIVASIVLAISCGKPKVVDTVVAVSAEVNEDVADTLAIPEAQYMDSTINQGIKYKAMYTFSDEFVIIKGESDTIYRDSVTGPFMQFRDFDGDGNDDIFISYMGNNMTEDLFLYDAQSKAFRKVDGFIEFPEYTQIGKTKYHYYYHRSGCADYDWTSDLFYIQNYKTFKIGTIYGNGCDYEENTELGIHIYKVKGETTKQIEKINIDTINTYQDYKWGFIKEYWTKNYTKFITK